MQFLKMDLLPNDSCRSTGHNKLIVQQTHVVCNKTKHRKKIIEKKYYLRMMGALKNRLCATIAYTVRFLSAT